MSRRSLNNYQQRHAHTAKIERNLHGFMDGVLGNSQRVCDQLKEEGVASDRLGLIYNGLDLGAFDQPRNPTNVRNDLGINAEALVFIIVANLIPYKGHVDLLNALEKAKANLPEGWRLLCVGRDTGIGDYLKECALRLGIDDHILWLGERRDMSDLLAASDIGLLVSHEEGFSNSVLEGMASGLPMVVTDVGGNAEAVIDHQTGFVVPSKSPEDLCNALLKLATDRTERVRMGTAGRRRIEEYFQIDTCVEHYVNLYEALQKRPQGDVAKAINNDQT